MAKSKMEQVKEFKERATKCNQIVIYGAGLYGQLVLKKLHEWNIYKKTVFAVTGEPEEMEVMGVDVLSIDTYKAAGEEVFVIPAVGVALTPEMVLYLKELEVSNYMELTNELRAALKEVPKPPVANVNNRASEQQQELLREIYQNIYQLTERIDRLENLFLEQTENKIKIDAIYNMLKGNV